MNIREKVAERLQIARKKAGMTQVDLAKICGYSRGRLSNWESANRMPSAQEIHRMAEVLKVSPSWLFCFTDDIAEYETPTGAFTLFPVLSFEDLNKPNMLDKLTDPEKRTKMLHNYPAASFAMNGSIEISSSTFGLNINDDSMQPELLQEDIIIVDPSATPTPGKYVLAQSGNNIPIVRMFRQPSYDEIQLISANKNWPDQTFKTNDNSIKILGAVIELRRTF